MQTKCDVCSFDYSFHDTASVPYAFMCIFLSAFTSKPLEMFLRLGVSALHKAM